MRSVCMVRMSTLASFSCLKMRRVASIPFSSGSVRSINTTSGCRRSASSTALRPSPASPTTSISSSVARMQRSPCRTMVWSSTSNTRIRSITPCMKAYLVGLCFMAQRLRARESAEKWGSRPQNNGGAGLHPGLLGVTLAGRGGSVLARAPPRGDEAELPELRPQRFARHAQAARRGGAVIAMLAEPCADGRELDLAHDLLERARTAPRCRGRALDDPRGEEVGRDALARLRAQDEPVDLVLQLAHVAGPRVALEEPERARVEAAELLRLLGADPLEQVQREEPDVCAALAQRREPDREDAQPVVEVRAEAAFAGRLPEVAVARRDHAHVDLPPAVAAHRPHLAVLQHAQELRLDGGARLAHLVQEERPPVGLFEEAAPRPFGAGEGAAQVAEELALEEPLGERGAVLGEEGATRARAVIVDGAREELLARPGLALEQHRHPRLCRALGQEEGVLDGGALADDAVEAVALAQLAAEPARLAPRGAQRAPVARRRPLELAAAERLAHHHRHGDEVLAVLDEVVARAELHRLDRHLLRAGAGDHDDRQVGIALPDLAQALEPVGVGQAVVEEDAVDLVGGQMLEAVAGRARDRHLERVAPRAERTREEAGRLGAILDQQDARRHARAPSRTRRSSRAGPARARA